MLHRTFISLLYPFSFNVCLLIQYYIGFCHYFAVIYVDFISVCCEFYLALCRFVFDVACHYVLCLCDLIDFVICMFSG